MGVLLPATAMEIAQDICIINTEQNCLTGFVIMPLLPAIVARVMSNTVKLLNLQWKKESTWS